MSAPTAASSLPKSEPASSSSGRSLRLTFVLAFVAVFALCMLRLPATKFLWDAGVYWSGTSALLGPGSTAQAGLLDIRGVLTPFVFVPAVLAAHLGVPATLAVLVQNSLLLAATGSLLLPALLQRLIQVTRRHVWVCSGATVLLFSGFAPFPLLDMWTVALMLSGVWLLSFKQGWVALLAGLTFAVAGNLRPAYLVPVAVIMVIWAIRNWRQLAWPAVGTVVGFIPQVAFNWVSAHVLSPLPVAAGQITVIQATYSGYTVRYDTVAYYPVSAPQQIFCSPDMAAAIGQNVPSSTLGVLKLFLTHPLQSIPFAAEKLATTLSWDWATPYGQPAAYGFPWLGIISTLVAVVGMMAIVARTVRGRRTSATALALFALVGVAIITIVGTTPETRFGAPVLAVAILGIAMLASPPTSMTSRRDRVRRAVIPGLVALVLAAGITSLAVVGTSHPAPPGNANAAQCASQ